MRKSRWPLVLLGVPFAALLYPPLYASERPELLGFPFFYWYQFAIALLAVILTAIAHRATRREG